MLTHVLYLRLIFYPRLLQWVQRITKKSSKLKSIQNTFSQFAQIWSNTAKSELLTGRS